MPYRWTPPQPDDGDRVVLQLWPHRSLPAKGFVVFIAITAAFLSLPLLATIGTFVLWGLMPFAVAAVAGVWWALSRSYRDGRVLETLTLAKDLMRLERHNPDGTVQDWQANPYWVRITLHANDGPVENYLTLKGNDREVELGAFMSPEERETLAGELRSRVAGLR